VIEISYDGDGGTLAIRDGGGGVAARDRSEIGDALRREAGLRREPSLDAASAAIDAPLATLDFSIRVAGRAASCPGWVGDAAAVLTLPPDPETGWTQVTAVPPTWLADRVAALVSLGPRPRHSEEGSLFLTRAVIDDHVARGDGAAPPPLDDSVPAAWIESVFAGDAYHWALEVSPTDDSPLLARRCEAIDSGSRGLWTVFEVAPEVADQAVVTATSTHVWRALCGLLVTS
jgi:hypothetical protein